MNIRQGLAICGLVSTLYAGLACSSTKPKNQPPVPTNTPAAQSTSTPTATNTPVDIVTNDAQAKPYFHSWLALNGVAYTPNPTSTPMVVMICLPSGTCTNIDNMYEVSASGGTPTPYPPAQVYVRDVGDLTTPQATAVAYTNSSSAPPGYPKIFVPASSSYAGIQATPGDYYLILDGLAATFQTQTGKKIR